MKMLGWIAALALVLLSLFAVANWTLLTAPASLNFLAFTMQGPLGLILLGATLLFVALFAVYGLSLRTSALVETRRHMRELETQRDLAEKAEASRFTALGTQLGQECSNLRSAIEEARGQMLQRSDTLERSLAQAIYETSNGMFANIGQVDEKLDQLVRAAGRGDASSH